MLDVMMHPLIIECPCDGLVLCSIELVKYLVIVFFLIFSQCFACPAFLSFFILVGSEIKVILVTVGIFEKCLWF